jgi:hypothetical protein
LKSICTTELLNGITFGANQFVAVGYGSDVLLSPDAARWIIKTSGSSAYLNGVSYGDSLFAAVGS